MKILMGGLAALFLSASAFAQSGPAPATGTMTPGDVAQGPATQSPTAGEGSTTGSMGGDGSASSTTTASASPKLTEKNGAWWNGDRRATKDEIAEYKRSQPK